MFNSLKELQKSAQFTDLILTKGDLAVEMLHFQLYEDIVFSETSDCKDYTFFIGDRIKGLIKVAKYFNIDLSSYKYGDYVDLEHSKNTNLSYDDFSQEHIEFNNIVKFILEEESELDENSYNCLYASICNIITQILDDVLECIEYKEPILNTYTKAFRLVIQASDNKELQKIELSF